MKSFLLVVAVLTFANNASAECVAAPICSGFDFAMTVFLADVRDVVFVPERGPSGNIFIDIAFDVREAFSNSRPGPTTLRIAYSSEQHSFRQGERVLVFASRNQDGAWGLDCSRTRPTNDDDPELPTLRHLSRGDAGGAVVGGLTQSRSGWNTFPGVRITLRPVSGKGARVSTTTGPAGIYRFDWVSPGEYLVVLEQQGELKRQQRRVRVAPAQKCLEVPTFIIPHSVRR